MSENSDPPRQKYYLETYRQEQREKKSMRIENYARKKRADTEKMMYNGSTLLVLDSTDMTRVSLAERLKDYFKQLEFAEKKGIFNNCFAVAQDAVNMGVATGRVASHRDTSDFVGWGNHCISFEELSDGTVVAFDLTTRKNIEAYQDGFDLLALRADSIEGLLEDCGKLYGGEWVVIQND